MSCRFVLRSSAQLPAQPPQVAYALTASPAGSANARCSQPADRGSQCASIDRLTMHHALRRAAQNPRDLAIRTIDVALQCQVRKFVQADRNESVGAGIQRRQQLIPGPVPHLIEIRQPARQQRGKRLQLQRAFALVRLQVDMLCREHALQQSGLSAPAATVQDDKPPARVGQEPVESPRLIVAVVEGAVQRRMLLRLYASQVVWLRYIQSVRGSGQARGRHAPRRGSGGSGAGPVAHNAPMVLAAD